ncbi:Aldo/keto reductase family-domain-containing protein [Suillus paluster]|uniref:Aldo/keto reductase family-domain-containing protein n=1 Tax=Suillus paluster TaxID=48578 RepID=UPI001B869D0E|nr:Aldo/keto reductase family-domain-containing protein [Suillus paluster]KAG1739825.1 Aldo/keto reductase family-domain-containing protein [Suillus paluster]
MMGKFDAPDAYYPLPPLDEVPDDDSDKPKEADKLPTTPSGFPSIIFGAASFSHFYNERDHISGVTPLRATRLALRYGINAFDTSPYYGDSEIILGNALKALEQEFPRDSYTLITKVGRYATEFDYTPEGIESSIARSLRRMHTDYLDVVYLHDVEFVADEKLSKREGDHVTALGSERELYGLNEGQEGETYTEKDHKILSAVEKLFELRDGRGVIRRVGISGFPLPTLLRLAILIQKRLGKPLDLVMSYCHLTLQNSTIEQFKPAFESRARVKQVISASPLSMGLLRPDSPKWHPASPAVKDAAKSAVQLCEEWDASGAGLPNLALQYAFARTREVGMPIVVGLSTLEDVHASAKVWREVDVEGLATKEEWVARVKRVQDLFRDAQVMDYSWATPAL